MGNTLSGDGLWSVCSLRSKRRTKKFAEDTNLERTDLSFVPSKADPEMRAWVQVSHLGGDPRKYSEKVREVRRGKQKSP